MPLYDLVCSKCDCVDEVLLKHSDALPNKCARCGATDTLSRRIGPASFQLKGSGWAKDLYSSPQPTTKKTQVVD